MLFDEDNQEYCRYRNNPGMGDWRSPEEYDNKPLDEKIDVWSVGNNMYAILTGCTFTIVLMLFTLNERFPYTSVSVF
jgi:serine/threonine protein kinase